MARLVLTFNPPGPIADAFFRDRSTVAGIMGPQGSAKTSTALWRLFMTALEQAPHPLTGRRDFPCVTLRETYQKLWETTIPTWQDWFPPELGEFTGSQGNRAKHKIKFKHPSGDGSTVHFTLRFAALNDVTDLESFFRGFNAAAFHLCEADLLPRLALQYAMGRAGRAPKVDAAVGFGGPTWRGVLCDFNAPDIENWTYDTFVDNLPEGYAFFRQPGGRTPQAENLHNLPAGYYDRQVAGADDWWVRRFIDNEFGYSRDGKPVYPEYNDMLHCAAAPLLPLPGIPVHVGFDQGLNPAAVFAQEAPNGQIRWLDELVGDNVDAEEFGLEVNKFIAARFAECDFVGCPDPAGFSAAAEAKDKRSWAEILRNKTKIRMVRVLPSNLITPRLQAVRTPLKRMIGGREPGLIISPTCKMLRKGFNSMYRYRRIKVGGGERFTEVPEKNIYSNPHDAGQYANLGITGYAGVVGRRDREAEADRQALSASSGAGEYNPHEF